jgi:hypothetical protein
VLGIKRRIVPLFIKDYLWWLGWCLGQNNRIAPLYFHRCRKRRLNVYVIFKVKFKITLFSLGMATYSYERQDIIQFGLKRLPGRWLCRKKKFVRFSPPFTCCWWILGKMFPSCHFNSVCHKIYNIVIIDENYNKNIPPLQANSILPHSASYQVALTKKNIHTFFSHLRWIAIRTRWSYHLSRLQYLS